MEKSLHTPNKAGRVQRLINKMPLLGRHVEVVEDRSKYVIKRKPNITASCPKHGDRKFFKKDITLLRDESEQLFYAFTCEANPQHPHTVTKKTSERIAGLLSGIGVKTSFIDLSSGDEHQSELGDSGHQLPISEDEITAIEQIDPEEVLRAYHEETAGEEEF